ncbi:efflux RND transporter periplasmic adaptor subunit [Flavihumibacter profundi]|jgi:HlyD family secretion protein|uniref:efflux RND transporter periplasmic adaptor subunit n=1 Tax=Flavihumibacter profundi TaxID=2716883 RepID=UPI001CC3E450|nr:efflux RND transporter periplasmic adaptor subunit [Flavihumibacter profundi]MBZ5859550.1 efflux RND transporter periplasmic adaptor subunit [Flavihumibacter profundi]
MKRKYIITLVFVLILIGTISAYYILNKGKNNNAFTLNTEQVKKSAIASIVTSTGTIVPVDTVAVGTQISGMISKIHTDFNARVKKGQLLAELDPTIMQSTVEQIKGNLALAESNLAYQKINYERQKQLYDVGSISKANYDAAINGLSNAEAALSSIKAQLKSANKNLSFTKIYSPIDGVVLNRNISVGQTVAASFNTPTLFSIAKDITKMQAQAKVDEADIGQVSKGNRVTFTVDAFINDIFPGTVAEIRLQPTISANVVTYTTIINTNNDSLKLKPGMTATITIYTAEAEDVLTIPLPALKFKPSPEMMGKDYTIVAFTGARKATDKFVWVLKDKNITENKITTGINDNTRVQVLSGIKENDLVITGVSNEANSKANSESKSPFLPTMRRR